MTIRNINIRKNIDLLNNFIQNILCGKRKKLSFNIHQVSNHIQVSS